MTGGKPTTTTEMQSVKKKKKKKLGGLKLSGERIRREKKIGVSSRKLNVR